VTRALPASLTFHFVALALILLFGAHVDRAVIAPQRQIGVRLVEWPKPPQPRVEMPVEAEPEIEPVVEAEPLPEPEPAPVEPAPVPEDSPVAPEEAPPEPEPEPEIVEPEPEPVVEPVVEDPPAEVAPEPAPVETPVEAPPEETAIAGTDQVVPAEFQYYLNVLEQRVSRAWNPKMLGFREGSTRVCMVHFYIEPSGMIVRESVVQSSGVPLYDREALKAVKAVGRFLPLPQGLDSRALGVTYVFTLKSRP